MTHLTRRGFIGLAAVVGLAGCASTAPAGSNSGSKGETRSIAHVYGTTEVPAGVSRVACLGLASHDVCLALGVVPIAVQASEALNATLSPWFYTELMKVGGSFPEMLPRDEWTELVASMKQLRPELILAVNGQLTRKQFQELSKIAPVVAHPSTPSNTPWKDTTTIVADALGKPEKGAKLIARTESEIDKIKALYPGYAAQSALYLGYLGAQGADLEVYGAETNEMRGLEAFGLTPAPALAALTAAHDIVPTRRKLVPLADLQGAQSDLVVASIPDLQRDDELKGNRFSRTLGRTNDDTLLINARGEAYALQESSPLSLAWAAKSMIPEIARMQFSIANPQ